MKYLSKIENNLIELFSGNLPLYKSYWIYYVLVNFLISAPLLLVTKIHIQNFIFTFSLYLVLNLIYYFTSCIGVWRSSQRYKGNKISTYYFETEFLDIPAKFQINSKKFNANLYLKSFDIIE